MNALESQLFGTVTSMVASVLQDPIVQTGLRLAGWALLLTWVLSILWVLRDAGARTHNPIAIAAAATSVLLATPAAFPLAIIVWRILRPGQTLADSREQRLTIEALRVTTDTHRCGRCAMKVDAGWRRCPRCRNWLLASCPRCERLVELQSKACPWCAFDLVAHPLAPMPQSVPEGVGVGDHLPAGPIVPAAAAVASDLEAATTAFVPDPAAPAVLGPAEAAVISSGGEAGPADPGDGDGRSFPQPSTFPGVPVMAPSPGLPVMAVSADSGLGGPAMDPAEEASLGPASSSGRPALPVAATVPLLEPTPGFLMIQTGWMGSPAMVTMTAGSGAAEGAMGAAAFRATAPETSSAVPSTPRPAQLGTNRAASTPTRTTDEAPDVAGPSDAPLAWPPGPPPDAWPSLGDMWSAVTGRLASGDDRQDGDPADKPGDGSSALW